MAKVKPTLRKKLTKYIAKLVKKHGAEFSIGVATGIVTDILLEKANTKTTKKKPAAKKKTVKKKK